MWVLPFVFLGREGCYQFANSLTLPPPLTATVILPVGSLPAIFKTAFHGVSGGVGVVCDWVGGVICLCGLLGWGGGGSNPGPQ